MSVNYATVTQANVYLRSKLAGKLTKINPKKYVFEYEPEYIRTKGISIGITLDISRTRFETDDLHPFFDNLIPEGWLLRHAEKVHKIDKDNRFAILMATGRHPVGAVKVIPLDEEAQEIEPEFDDDTDDNEALQSLVNLEIPNICPYCLKTLNSVVDKDKKFHQRCAKNLWGTARPLQISLNSLDPLDSFRKTIYGASISGAQRKGLFNLNKTILRSATNEAHFILKPPGDYEQLPENEHVTMAIAKDLGFNVPDIGIFETTAGRVFVIKRFDIIKSQQARLEDIAQILRIPSENKNESSNEKVGQVINKYSDIPKLDVIDYWRRLLFCYITANGDMHLKNWSLLEMPTMKGLFSLSPCYDFLNTRIAISKEKIDIGLTLNGKSAKLQWSYFKNFAKNDLQIDDSIITKQREEFQGWFNKIEEMVSVCFLNEARKEQYIEISRERLRILLA